MAEPFAYEDYRKQRIRDKLEEERTNRVKLKVSTSSWWVWSLMQLCAAIAESEQGVSRENDGCPSNQQGTSSQSLLFLPSNLISHVLLCHRTTRGSWMMNGLHASSLTHSFRWIGRVRSVLVSSHPLMVVMVTCLQEYKLLHPVLAKQEMKRNKKRMGWERDDKLERTEKEDVKEEEEVEEQEEEEEEERLGQHPRKGRSTGNKVLTLAGDLMGSHIHRRYLPSVVFQLMYCDNAFAMATDTPWGGG